MSEPYRAIIELYHKPVKDVLGDVFDQPDYRITAQDNGKLLIKSGKGLTQRLELALHEPVRIGRSSKCHIIIPRDLPLARNVSNMHGEIYRATVEAKQVWTYKNLSSNFTVLNGILTLKVHNEAILKGKENTLDVPHKSIAQLVLRLY